MKIAIVDSEIYWINTVKQYVESYFKERAFIIKDFCSGEAFLKCDEEFSIIFIDIEMPGMDGLSVLEEYGKKYREALFIILTFHIEMSRMGYKVNAFRYIDKYFHNEIYEALEAAELRLCQYQTIDIPVVSMGMLTIRCQNVVYFEAYGHDIVMHTLDDERNRCGKTLSELAKCLQQKNFVLTDRSHLVNLEHIKTVEPNHVVLSTGILLPLSRRRYSLIKKSYFKWKMQCVDS